jgi:hypothetical protein
MLKENNKSYRLLPVNFLYQNNRPVPVIQLQGKWLQKFGFQPGDTLLVERQAGTLVIRPLFNEISSDSSASLNS